MEILSLYKHLKQLGLSPNDFAYLSHRFNNIDEDFSFNENISKRHLVKNGFLDKSYNLTQKAKELFEAEPSEVNPIEKFRQIFPKGILPNGKPAKSSLQELDKKFKWFFLNHNYTWDVVYKATKDYVGYYAKKNYNFMQTASNFVSKQDNDRIKSSALAEWCEKIKSGDETVEEFDINV